nr:hypothetical protein [Neisseria meningitidis]
MAHMDNFLPNWQSIKQQIRRSAHPLRRRVLLCGFPILGLGVPARFVFLPAWRCRLKSSGGQPARGR